VKSRRLGRGISLTKTTSALEGFRGEGHVPAAPGFEPRNAQPVASRYRYCVSPDSRIRPYCCHLVDGICCSSAILIGVTSTLRLRYPSGKWSQVDKSGDLAGPVTFPFRELDTKI